MVLKISLLLTFLPICEIFGVMAMSMNMECMEIRGYAGCACKMSDSSKVIGLRDVIGNLSESIYPRFVAQDNSTHWFYTFQPCKNFNLFADGKPHMQGYQACIGSGAAYFTNQSIEQCFGFGSQDDSKFIYDPDFKYPVVSNLSLLYRNMSDLNRNGGQISLICNWTIPANESKFTYVDKTYGVLSTWYFALESICCCPGGCPGDYHEMSGEKSRIWYYVGPIIAVVLVIIIILAIVSYKYYTTKRTAGVTRLA